MSLLVLDPGLQSLLVGARRLHNRSLGVPIGGAADQSALTLGNALVGNSACTTAIEISLRGPVLRANANVGAVVFGAGFEIASDRQSITAGTTFTLIPGETLRIGGAVRGMRTYLCVAGGFQSPLVLDSLSALAPISAGAELICPASTISRRFLAADAPSALPREKLQELRFLPGAQSDWFDRAQFISQAFIVTAASNRMGLRLKSEPLRTGGPELTSEPVSIGTVQVTNDGQCIILGVDGQTIGGYPKIAHVIQADFDKIGQLRPNDQIRFVSISLEDAESAFLRQHAELHRWQARIAARLDCTGILPSSPL